MSLIRISADNPAALLAAAVLLFVLGLVGIASLPIQMLPMPFIVGPPNC